MSAKEEGELAALHRGENREAVSFSHLLSLHATQLASLQSQLWAAHVRVVNRLELKIRELSQENAELLSKNCKQGKHSDHQKYESLVDEIMSTEVTTPPQWTSEQNGGPQPPLFSPLQLPTAWAHEVLGDFERKLSKSSSKGFPADVVSYENLPGQSFPPKEAAHPSNLPKVDQKIFEPQPLREPLAPLKPVLKKNGTNSSLATSNISSILPTASDSAKAPVVKRSTSFQDDHAQKRKSASRSSSKERSSSKDRAEPMEVIQSDDEGSSGCRSHISQPTGKDGEDGCNSHATEDPDGEDQAVTCQQSESSELHIDTTTPRLASISSMQSKRQETEALWELAPIWLTHTRPKLMRRSDRSDRSHGLTTQMATMAFSKADGSLGVTSVFGERDSVDSGGPAATTSRFVLHPGSAIAHGWELFGLLLLLYDLVVVPLDFFGTEDRSNVIIAMSWTTCCYWTLTMVVACNRGYIDDHGSIIFQRALIIRRYACTWLMPDMFALGFSWVDLAVNRLGTGRIYLWVSELRLIRMVRLARAPAVVGLTFERARSDRGVLLSGVFKIVSLIVGYAHITACLWYGVGRNSQGWVEREGLSAEPLPNRYVTSFFWALAAFVGEVANAPTNPMEQGYTAGVILLSFLISASFVSSLTTSMTQLQIVSREASSNMSALRQYLSENDVPRALAVKLMRNAQHSLEENKRRAQESSIELLKSVSEPLMAELHFELRGRHLAAHPLLRKYILINPSGIKKVCHVGCQFYTFAMGDIVFNEFEVPASPRMLFLIEGKLTYRAGKDTESSRVLPGGWASEAALWLATWTYLGTMTANCESQVMALDAQRFGRIVHTYPTAHLKVYARLYVDYIKRLCDERLLNDLCADLDELDTMVDDCFKIAEDEELLSHHHGSVMSRSTAERRSIASHISAASVVKALPQRLHKSSMRQRTVSVFDKGTDHRQGAGRSSLMSNFPRRWL